MFNILLRHQIADYAIRLIFDRAYCNFSRIPTRFNIGDSFYQIDVSFGNDQIQYRHVSVLEVGLHYIKIQYEKAWFTESNASMSALVMGNAKTIIIDEIIGIIHYGIS